MNVFQIIYDTLYVEDEEDVNFLKENSGALGIDVSQIKLGAIIKLNKKQKEYIVKPLDTIESISKKLCMDENDLLKKIGNNKLFIGQKIVLD